MKEILEGGRRAFTTIGRPMRAATPIARRTAARTSVAVERVWEVNCLLRLSRYTAPDEITDTGLEHLAQG